MNFNKSVKITSRYRYGVTFCVFFKRFEDVSDRTKQVLGWF